MLKWLLSLLSVEVFYSFILSVLPQVPPRRPSLSPSPFNPLLLLGAGVHLPFVIPLAFLCVFCSSGKSARALSLPGKHSLPLYSLVPRTCKIPSPHGTEIPTAPSVSVDRDSFQEFFFHSQTQLFLGIFLHSVSHSNVNP